ncbi:hypothetical protein RJG79_05830 [Mycoplasmatota bacterium WC44]
MSWNNSLDRLLIPNDIVISLTEIYKHQGRQIYHNDIIKNDMKIIIEQTIERDIFYFSKLLELNITEGRLRALSTKEIMPKNNSEKTILNLKQALKNIFDNYESFEFSTNEIQSIHSHIFKSIANVRFAKTEVKTKFHSQKTINKRNELDDLFAQVTQSYEKSSYEKVLLSVLLFIDFYNVKGFAEMNEYTSLVLIHLLLLKVGFDNFKYVSFFEYILNNFEDYRTALIAATFSYEEGLSQPLHMIRFFIKALKETYSDVEQIVKNHQFDKNLNKSYSIQNTIFKLPEIFQKDDLRRLHPYISDSTINRTLVRLREEGMIKPLGKGRSAKWIRLKNMDKFNIEEQLSLDIF